MSWFSRKPRVSVVDWCDDFYDQYVFAAPIGDCDPWQLHCDSLVKTLAEVDYSVNTVDRGSLYEHLLALRLEVIAIAWLLTVKDRYAPLQSECTRTYLKYIKQDKYWMLMEPYNRATAKATTGGVDPRSRSGRAFITFINSMRTQLFDEWVEIVSPEDASRAANRIGSETPWKDKRTHVYLSYALTDQLHVEFNDAARASLLTAIQGFYDGAVEKLRQCKIVAS